MTTDCFVYRVEVIESPATGRAAGSIEILGDADPGEGGMVTYMLLYGKPYSRLALAWKKWGRI